MRPSSEVNLKDVRYHAVGHQFAVLGPVRAIFGGTLLLVAEHAVDQQHHQEKEVQQGPEVITPTGRQAPREGSHQLEYVVEMTRHSPATGNQQLRGFFSQLIANRYATCWLTPNFPFIFSIN